MFVKLQMMNELKNIAQVYGAKVQFQPSLECAGRFDLVEKIIRINSSYSRETQIYAFFHELGHFHACVKNKWRKYHDPAVPFSEKSKIGLKVERAMDKFAVKKVKKYFPEVQIAPYYSGAAGKKRFYSFVDSVNEID